MRVMVGKIVGGKQDVTIVPSRRAHMAPLTIRGRPEGAFWDVVRENMGKVREREEAGRAVPGPDKG